MDAPAPTPDGDGSAPDSTGSTTPTDTGGTTTVDTDTTPPTDADGTGPDSATPTDGDGADGVPPTDVPQTESAPAGPPPMPPQNLGNEPGNVEVHNWAVAMQPYYPDLTVDQIKGIYDYTTDSGYTVMNGALRTCGPMGIDASARISLALEGLQRLPAFEGTAYRGQGTPAGVMAQLESQWAARQDAIAEGEDPAKLGDVTYLDPAFMSTSTDPAVADNFTGAARPGEVPTVMTVHGHSGRDVFPFSAAQTEAEILMPPGTHFRLDDLWIDANGVRHMILTEY